MQENREKKYEKCATTKLNVKFNSPHLNEGKARHEARQDDVASYSCRSSLLLLLPALTLSLSLPTLPLSNSIEAFGRPTEAAAAAAALRAAFVAA